MLLVDMLAGQKEGRLARKQIGKYLVLINN